MSSHATIGIWEKRKLQDFIELISGQHIDVADYNTEGVGVPYLTGPADFPDGQVISTKYTNKPKAMCKAGDILITVKGSGVGKVIVADKDYCISRQLMAIRTDENLRELIFYNLKLKEKKYNSDSAGLIPGIGRKDILNTYFYLPNNFAESKKIGEIIMQWDKAINLKEKLIKQKKEQKKGLMQKLLTGQMRLPGFDGEWKKYTLEQTAIKFTDGDWIESPYIVDNGVRLIQTGNIGLGYFIEKNNKKYISSDSFQELKCTEIKPGDILICRLAEPIGRSCIAPNYNEKMITSVDVAILTVNQEIVSNQFLNYFLNLPQTLQVMDSLGAGSTRKRISRKNMAQVALLLPRRDEQAVIVNILSALDRQIDLLVKENEELKYQKQALMQSLLTGKIRVKA